jgi:hypothetical protein
MAASAAAAAPAAVNDLKKFGVHKCTVAVVVL